MGNGRRLAWRARPVETGAVDHVSDRPNRLSRHGAAFALAAPRGLLGGRRLKLQTAALLVSVEDAVDDGEVREHGDDPQDRRHALR